MIDGVNPGVNPGNETRIRNLESVVRKNEQQIASLLAMIKNGRRLSGGLSNKNCTGLEFNEVRIIEITDCAYIQYRTKTVNIEDGCLTESDGDWSETYALQLCGNNSGSTSSTGECCVLITKGLTASNGSDGDIDNLVISDPTAYFGQSITISFDVTSYAANTWDVTISFSPGSRAVNWNCVPSPAGATELFLPYRFRWNNISFGLGETKTFSITLEPECDPFMADGGTLEVAQCVASLDGQVESGVENIGRFYFYNNLNCGDISVSGPGSASSPGGSTSSSLGASAGGGGL